MSIYFGTQNVRAIADAVPLYDSKEFESPTRSTIPMLSLLMHRSDLFNNIVGPLGFPPDSDLFLEYTVAPPIGQGNASHTDVMLKSKNRALAIEGKWTEPMYPTVAEWLNAGANPANRIAVLGGWLGLLQQRTPHLLEAGQFNLTIYQMVHRAASAATAELPSLAYFLFKPSPDMRAADPNAVFTQLSHLWNVMGQPTRFPFYLVEIEANPLDAYEPLNGLQRGEETTAEVVSAALQDSKPLFSFAKDPIIRTVGG